MVRKFEVKNSKIDGKGCFATSLIKKGELIGVMRGGRLSISKLKRKYRKGELRSSDPLQVEEKGYLNLFKPYIYFNHSCKPNAAIIGRAKLIAIKNIKQGEEIAYDYSSTEWTSDEFDDFGEWIMKCDCGCSSCRKKIKRFQTLPMYLQNKYISKKLVQDFILKKYYKANKE